MELFRKGQKMRRVVAAVLLVLMICGLCACKKAEKANPAGLNEPILGDPSQNQTVVEGTDAVTVTTLDCSDFSVEELEPIRNWWQCPIEQGLYMLIYEETDIASRYEIPEVLDGYWTVEDYHNDADALLNVEAITARQTYNFVLSIYDHIEKTLYEIHFNNEQ